MARKTVMPAPPGGGLLGKFVGALVGLAIVVIVIKYPNALRPG